MNLLKLSSLVIPLFALPVALRAQTASPNVITSCVSKLTSVSRIVASSSSCNANTETVVLWNQQGPAGAPGATGSQGAPGVAGSSGPTGATGSFSPTGVLYVATFDTPPADSTKTGATGMVNPIGLTTTFAGSSPMNSSNSAISPTACTMVAFNAAALQYPPASDGKGPAPVSAQSIKLFLYNNGHPMMECAIASTVGGGSCSDTTHTFQVAPGDRLSVGFGVNPAMYSAAVTTSLVCQ